MSATQGDWTIQSINGMQYMVLLPDGYDPSVKYPTTLYLHALDNGNPGPEFLQTQIDSYFNTAQFRTDHPSIIVAPVLDQTADTSGETINWGGVSAADTDGETNAIAALQQVMSQYSVDPSRVYVTGNSMGGIGTEDMLTKFNAYTGTQGKIFAAGLALAGADYGQDPNTMASVLQDVPYMAIHGAQDTQVPLTTDQTVYAAIHAAGGKMIYNENPNLGHDVWDTYYTQTGQDSPLSWLYSQSTDGSSQTTASSVQDTSTQSSDTSGVNMANTGTDVSNTGTVASDTAPSNMTGPDQSTGGLPAHPDHIVVVVEENHGTSDLLGSGQAPYLDSLAQQGAVIQGYKADAHPSEPNYFALFSGDTQGITDDGTYAETAPSLAGDLKAAGKTFTGYAESGSPQKHNPWESFADAQGTGADFSQFPTDFSQLPTVSFVSPDLNNDMHDGSVQQGDQWLQQNINAYAQWAKANNSELIVTADEDDGSGDNSVPAIVVGAGVTPGSTLNAPADHVALFHAIEDQALGSVSNTGTVTSDASGTDVSNTGTVASGTTGTDTSGSGTVASSTPPTDVSNTGTVTSDTSGANTSGTDVSNTGTVASDMSATDVSNTGTVTSDASGANESNGGVTSDASGANESNTGTVASGTTGIDQSNAGTVASGSHGTHRHHTNTAAADTSGATNPDASTPPVTTPPSNDTSGTDASVPDTAQPVTATTTPDTASGNTLPPTSHDVTKGVLGSTPTSLQFSGASGASVTGGPGVSIVSAVDGDNSFTAGSGFFDITGGTGADSYTFGGSQSSFLVVEDFSAAKGDVLNIASSLKAGMQTTEDGHNTLLAFGNGSAIELHGVTTAPAIHWT
jgi:dienelactone hydrolase